MLGVIKGTGSFIPPKIRSNDDLAQMVDTNDQWIQERTGVRNRHIIESETAVSMAIIAARHALEDAKCNPKDIDMILVATISSNVIMPNTACMIQHELGADEAVCMDLNAACSGFVFAYHTAQAYIATGAAENVLVIGTEALSTLVDWTDRGTCILFGDGAGAVVLSAAEGNVTPMVMHSSGKKGSALTCNTMHPDMKVTTEDMLKQYYIQMDGQEVFKFAVRSVPSCIQELLMKMEMNVSDIDLFILHQANRRIVESVTKRLGADIEKFPMNLMEYGNTSSASIPILLDQLHREGKLQSGMKIVMSGFGAGLTWGATYLEWV